MLRNYENSLVDRSNVVDRSVDPTPVVAGWSVLQIVAGGGPSLSGPWTSQLTGSESHATEL